MDEGSYRKQRQRWTESQRRKEPTLYDEYMTREKAKQPSPHLKRRSGSLSLGRTAASSAASTVRAVTHDEVVAEEGNDGERNALSERGETSFESRFLPSVTTQIMGGSAALEKSSDRRKDVKPRKLVKGRESQKDGPVAVRSSEKSTRRNGSNVSGMLVPDIGTSGDYRSSQEGVSHATVRSPAKVSGRKRPTYVPEYLDLPSNLPYGARRRQDSPNNKVPVPPSSGADYLASVPAVTSAPAAPMTASFGSSLKAPSNLRTGRRSTSSSSESAQDSATSSVPSTGARKILHLMRTLNGQMSGHVLLRRNSLGPWNQVYCHLQEANGDLMYEPRGGEGPHRTLASGLKGCKVKPKMDEDAPYLELNPPRSDRVIQLRLLTQTDHECWYAALLYWQSLEPTPDPSEVHTSPSLATPSRPEPPPRASSVRHRRKRTGSSKSERRKSVGNSLKEAPVIKIGKMIMWDSSITNAAMVLGQPSIVRPSVHRLKSAGSRTWTRISGQLRENGELKLHTDVDNNLKYVIQLSQLSRCAIQRLDPSVLENEFCIAIYPQYTSSVSNNPPDFKAPIFLGLESRVLFEVWFVLLRAFTIPQLYGPQRTANEGSKQDKTGSNQDLEDLLATSTADMFRVERSLNIRIVEARLHQSISGKGAQSQHNKTEQYGHYAEILLDNEKHAKTVVKCDRSNLLWGESFEFLDLPTVLQTASVVIKRRALDHVHALDQHESDNVHKAPKFIGDEHAGATNLAFDVTCGKAEVYLQELEDRHEIEKWWPLTDTYDQRVGELLIKARAEESVVLMERDYQPLNTLLHHFSNGLTLHISQMVPSEMKRLSDCLLDIFQVSGKSGDWIMALIEEEIDGVHKETLVSKLRFDKRLGSDPTYDSHGSVPNARELIVRDMNKNAALEANLLFRGNTLLTRSLDSYMRRIGKDYLEESIGAKIREIQESDPDCEVDPSRVTHPQDIDRNWRKLLLLTQGVWKAILASRSSCPKELRVVFRHIRACAEDRYGDHMRSVSYSSVSGFLFLRFFCPAVLNPKLFGLLKEDVKLRARRALTLIAKSLQTLSNMASFGAKETWMEPMNAFLTQNREAFKSFIIDVCYVPPRLAVSSSPAQIYPPGVLSADTNLSYATPMTIMQRLPPTSREGFPSLPYLIDQARAYAELVHLWLEATTPAVDSSDTPANVKSRTEVLAAITATGGDLLAFHETCMKLHKRTQECLSRAERTERPNSAVSFQWQELFEQLRTDEANNDPASVVPMLNDTSLDTLDTRAPVDLSIAGPSTRPFLPDSRSWTAAPRGQNAEIEHNPSSTRPEKSTAAIPISTSRPLFDFTSLPSRPSSSSLLNTARDNPRRAQLTSRGSDSAAASATASNASSAVSSDAEIPTALPSYEREVRHQERRDAAKVQIKESVEAARVRKVEKEERRRAEGKTTVVGRLGGRRK